MQVQTHGRAAARLLQFLGSASAVALLAASPAAAKTERPILDANSVNVISREFEGLIEDLSIGSGSAGLSVSRRIAANRGTPRRMFPENDYAAYYTGVVNGAQWIEFHDRVVSFDAQGTSDQGRLVSTANSITFHAKDGTIYTFGQVAVSSGPLYEAHDGLLTEIRRPDGRTIAISWDLESTEEQVGQESCCMEVQYTAYSRISSINNNSGYQLKFKYEQDSPTWDNMTSGKWNAVTQIKALNNTLESIAPTSTSTATANAWPSVSYSYPSGGQPANPFTFTATRSSGEVNVSSASGSTVTLSGPATGNVSITSANTVGGVASLNDNGIVTTYSAPNGHNGSVYRATSPTGRQTTWTSDAARERLVSVADPAGTASFLYDEKKRLVRATAPEGDYTSYSYDARSNVTETRMVAKPGTGLGDIVLTAGYAANCTSPATCDKPLWTKDAAGNQTDYDYDPATGQIVTGTLPAPAVGAARPQTRYAYSSRTAWYKNGSGVLAASPVAMSLLTSISECASGSSCTGTAAESVVEIDYGPAGVASNLLPVATTARSGNSSVVATTATTYDLLGSVTAVDGPLSGSADTVRYRYDASHRPVGEIGPDPDGSGPLKHRATRLGYNASGLLTAIETGTVNDQSDSGWAAMSTLETAGIDYDAARRKSKEWLSAGGVTQGLAQYSYDAEGALECTALRMNPAAFSSLPASACTLGSQGSHGPDRISRTVYDGAGRVWKLQSEYGTAIQADEATHSYAGNGKVASLTDAKGNVTTYAYDGHDRLRRTTFPNAVPHGATYEELTYASVAGGVQNSPHVASLRLRDGQNVGMTYDALGRVSARDMPGTQPDVYYGYDNAGRLLYARFGSHGGAGITNAYDALGRLTLSSSNMDGTPRSTSNQYDAAGNRTQLAASSGYTLNFVNDIEGQTIAVQESGPNTIALIGYDQLGRRSSLQLGSGGVYAQPVAYAYDAAGRLSSLTRDLTGAGHDQSAGFSYNPASQIVQKTSSIDAYAWNGHYNVSRSYTANGLNQYLTAGPASFTYDARGNLISDGSTSFTYDSENRLLTASGEKNATLSYDPLGRLWQLTGGGTTTRFVYDGDALIEEYDQNGTRLRAYAHGPGTDEPLVWYELTGGPLRRFLHAHERGSVVAAADESGAALSLNSYDEFGIPASANLGRFQYTRQTWLPELGMYYYKARMYSATLGRFMQADPIGYAEGMNLYAYVGNDPINGTDPTGTQIVVTSPCRGGEFLQGGKCYSKQGSRLSSTRQDGCSNPSFADDRDRCQLAAEQRGSRAPRADSNLLAKAGRCASDQLGITELVAAGMVVAGQPIPGTKRFVTPGSSRGTSAAGLAADRIFGKTRLPARLPTVVGGPGTGRRLAISGTKSLARFGARAVPVVGWALLAYDGVKIAACVASESKP